MAIIPGLMTYSYHRSVAERRIDAPRLVDRAAALGLRSMEWCHFPCHEPGNVDWDQVRLLESLAGARGIRSSVAGFAPLLAEGEDRARMLDMVRTQLAVSRAIGAGRLRFHGMTELALGIGVPAPVERCLDNLRRVVALAEESGIVIALENHMDFRAVDFRFFFEHIGSPYLALNLDTGNQLPLFEDTTAFAREFSDRIASCHLKGCRFLWQDSGALLTSCPPRDSLVDLYALLALLDRIPRDIPTHVEVVTTTADDEDRLVGEYAEFMRAFLTAAGPAPGQETP